MTTRPYTVIKRPIITEKGLGVKETQHTVVFEVATDATKTEIKEAVQTDFQGERWRPCARRRFTESSGGAGARKVTGGTGRKRT